MYISLAFLFARKMHHVCSTHADCVFQIMAQQDESCTTYKQSNMHTAYSETSMNPSLMCHFPSSIIHFLITSDVLFPRVSFSHISPSEFLVLTHSIPRMIISEKK